MIVPTEETKFLKHLKNLDVPNSIQGITLKIGDQILDLNHTFPTIKKV